MTQAAAKPAASGRGIRQALERSGVYGFGKIMIGSPSRKTP